MIKEDSEFPETAFFKLMFSVYFCFGLNNPKTEDLCFRFKPKTGVLVRCTKMRKPVFPMHTAVKQRRSDFGSVFGIFSVWFKQPENRTFKPETGKPKVSFRFGAQKPEILVHRTTLVSTETLAPSEALVSENLTAYPFADAHGLIMNISGRKC